MKYGIMSLTKINKEYKTLAKVCAKEGVLGGFKNQIILVTDSKGHSIRRVLPSLAKLKIISKSGATAADGDLIEEVRNNIKGKNKPVVLVWFGTCELTVKRGKYIKLRNHPYQNAEICLTEYRDFKEKILDTNNNTKIVFLDCPYYSPKKYHILNKSTTKGQNEPDVKGDSNNQEVISNKKKRKVIPPLYEDKNLSSVVDYFNNHLKLLNDLKTPRFTTDIIASHKKTDTRTKYRKNYNLYYDGIHPIRPLAKLWMYKLIRFASKISSK